MTQPQCDSIIAWGSWFAQSWLYTPWGFSPYIPMKTLFYNCGPSYSRCTWFEEAWLFTTLGCFNTDLSFSRIKVFQNKIVCIKPSSPWKRQADGIVSLKIREKVYCVTKKHRWRFLFLFKCTAREDIGGNEHEIL